MTDGFCDFALAVGLFHTQISDLVAESESGANFCLFEHTCIYIHTHGTPEVPLSIITSPAEASCV